jgi:hypothetical protein
MSESMAADPACEHVWEFSKPAHASASLSVCRLCHEVDGHELMRTLNEYAQEYAKLYSPKPVSLIYGHSGGQTISAVDQDGGIPDSSRERALLRALLTHALTQLDQYEISGSMLAVAMDAP